MTNASDLLRIYRSRGCDASTIRDALHEATHVVQSNARNWEREALHRALERKARRDFYTLMRFELQARAVEMLGCERLGVEYDIEKWAMICAMETAKGYGASIGELDQVVDAIRTVSKQRETARLLDAVFAMKPRRATATLEEMIDVQG